MKQFVEQIPVFFDVKGKRWRQIRRFIYAFVVSVMILSSVLAYSLVATPHVPNIKLNTAVNSTDDAANNGKPDWALDDSKPSAISEKPRFSQKRVQSDSVKTPVFASNSNQTKPISVGFYVNWDDRSFTSLKQNLPQLDWIVPDWIHLKDDQGSLAKDFDQQALDLIRKEKPNALILPLVQNYVNEQWDSNLIAKFLANKQSRQNFVDSLLQIVQENHFGGVTVDFESVPETSQANFLALVSLLHTRFNEHSLLVAQVVPFDGDDDWNYRAYADATDYLLLTAYDEHWSTIAPGPISSQPWFETVLKKRFSELNPDKAIVCIGNYGYEWSNRKKEAKEVSFQEAVLSLQDSEETIVFDNVSKNPYFLYTEEDGSHHAIWFLDAVTAFNQIHYSQQFHPAGYALWRLGAEDPSLWNVFGNDKFETPNIEKLKTLSYGYDIDFEGAGEILQVSSEPKDGARDFAMADDGTIKSEHYTELPQSFVIQQTGDRDGLVALTFDDGPDAVWTPQILDILKRENVSGSFYIVGQNGQAYPNLVKRIVNEGHDIGNHSFTHPNMGELPEALNAIELNATQRLIQSLTGRSTNLMRPPFLGDTQPGTAEQVAPLVLAKHLGYLTIGLHIDPNDWARPGREEIVRRTVEGITNKSPDPDKRGQIVLLHDAGGDRQQTVDALPQIIQQLKAKGYRFVTTTELAGLTQEQTMPFVQTQSVVTNTNNLSFQTMSWLGKSLSWLFFVGIILGVARLFMIMILALLAKRKDQCAEILPGNTSSPLVSVIVPAYNEEKLIVKTIDSLLKSDYKNLEIIVVDDGSSDQTSQCVAAKFAGETRVRLIIRDNGGKSEALNLGFKRSRGEIIIGLDADTVFETNTISVLVDHFADKKVGAVAGNAKVGNRLNIVTKWQALEYVTAQNLERRVLSWINAITVVPGAVGAWRREAVEAANGFSSNTLAEDQDLTLKVRMLGYKIVYAEKAVAWTEAPDTLKNLSKQRFRWAYGTLQCMWKHKKAFLRPKYGALGCVAMPNVWLFQILFQLISPLVDLTMIWAVVAHVIERLEHPNEFDLSKLENVIFYYVLFLSVDFLSAILGFFFEPKEDKKLLLWLPIQRFGYRQVMYTVMLRSIITAFKGVGVGWNKFERKNTVQAEINQFFSESLQYRQSKLFSEAKLIRNSSFEASQ